MAEFYLLSFAFFACILLAILSVSEKRDIKYFSNTMHTFDTNCIGDYNDKVGVSIYYWSLGVLVLCYKVCPSEDIRNLLLDWNNTCNHDNAHIILDSIEKAYTEMAAEVISANEENREPVFKVSCEFDYHILPKTLKHNDYVDMPTVIGYIDEILEVYNG